MKKIVIAAASIACLVAAAIILKNSLLLSSGDSYRPSDARYKILSRAKLVTVNGRVYFGIAWKERRDGYNLVSLHGEPYEMGFQHGILLKEEIRRGVVPVFADFISHMQEYRNKPLIVRRLIRLYLEITVFRPLENSIPAAYLQELKGIADGSGLDFRDIFIATFKSELAMIMTGSVISSQARSLGVAAECSGFTASGSATPDGKLIFGRNTDYAGQGRWMQNQTVFIYTNYGGISYINISTAGIIKCNAAMNNYGIVVGGHFMSFSGTTTDGLPFTILEHEIMRRSRTLEEAISLVRYGKRSTCFGFLIADGRNRTAAVVETNGPLVGVKYQEKGYIALANAAVTDELRKADLCAAYNLVMRDFTGRRDRLNQLIEANYGRITPEMAASFMGDHIVAETGKERVTGGTIGNVGNVTSAVFLPEDGIVWIGTGVEPACHNVFTPLDVAHLIGGRTKELNLPTLKGYRWKNPSLEKALREYMRAYISYLNDPDNVDAATGHLDKAIALDQREPIFRRVKALLILNAGKYDKLAESLGDVTNIETGFNDKALHDFVYAIGFDLNNEREKAVSHYGEILKLSKEHGVTSVNGINKLLYGLSKKFMIEKFTRNDLPAIPIGFEGTSGLE